MNRASFLKRVGVLVAVATVDPTNLHNLLDKGRAYPTYPHLLRVHPMWFISDIVLEETRLWKPELAKTMKLVASG